MLRHMQPLPQDVWMACRDQALVQSNLAKLVHFLEMRLVDPRLSPLTRIPKICPPFKLGGEEHISAARQRRSNSAQRIPSRHIITARIRNANA